MRVRPCAFRGRRLINRCVSEVWSRPRRRTFSLCFSSHPRTTTSQASFRPLSSCSTPSGRGRSQTPATERMQAVGRTLRCLREMMQRHARRRARPMVCRDLYSLRRQRPPVDGNNLAPPQSIWARAQLGASRCATVALPHASPQRSMLSQPQRGLTSGARFFPQAGGRCHPDTCPSILNLGVFEGGTR